MLISDKIIKPQNCVFCYGIPTSKKQFFESKNIGYAYRYNQKYSEDAWNKYQNNLLNIINSIESQLIDFGLDIKHQVNMEMWSSLFYEKKYDIIILYTHCEKDSYKKDLIEFTEVLIPTTTLNIN